MVLRYIAWAAFLVVAIAVAGLGVIQNARYGMWLDAGSGSQTITVLGIAFGSLGITFAVLNLFKVMEPPAIIEIWRRGHRGIATVVAIGFVGLASLSIWNTTSLQTIVRNDKDAAQQVERQRLAALRDQLAETLTHAKGLRETRLPGVIERELQALRHDVRWSSSKECQDATAKSSRSFCANYARLLGELSQANAVEQARLKMERLRSEIAQRTTLVGLRIADPELMRLAQLTGLDADSLGWWRALVFAIVFELVEAFGLTLAWLARPVPDNSHGDGASFRGGALAAIGEPPPRWLSDAHSNLPPALQVSHSQQRNVPCANEPQTSAETMAEGRPPEPALAARKSGDRASLGVRLKPAREPAPGGVKQPALTANSEPALNLAQPGSTAGLEQVEAGPDTCPHGAIAAFVAELETTPDGRATAGELFEAYEAMRTARGWPKKTQTAFGRSIRAAVEKNGGRKIKSRGQQMYLGIALPQHLMTTCTEFSANAVRERSSPPATVRINPLV